ncbi:MULTISPECIES: isochorismatase family protein [unclassified Bradyrhizobium]|uniref:YunG family protein n=1 Tax=unclassified Bradyrhizobium TaxID=2631580 RepID=UPI0028EB0531|nr:MULTISPECIES: isochorismatase family protein [unclassified Bradyrhizobium]
MDALIVVDMQVGLLRGPPKHNLQGVIGHINLLSKKVRDDGGQIIWIRHCGKAGDVFEPGAPDWEILPDLIRSDADLVVEKTLNDPYVGTPLASLMARICPERVIVTGWATDFCVDATVRSTVSHGYDVIAVSDGHTLSDRPHLPATVVIAHHNWLWGGLITNRSIRVIPTRELTAVVFDPDAIQGILRRSWSLATSSKWTMQNPAAGQCNVTSLLVHELFGGDLLKTPLLQGDHFYNRIEGVRYDFTESQFDQPITYSDIPADRAEAEKGATSTQLAALRAVFTRQTVVSN